MTRLAETIYNGHFSTHPFERTTAAGASTAPAGGGRPAEARENPYEPAQTGGSRPARKQAGPHGPEPPALLQPRENAPARVVRRGAQLLFDAQQLIVLGHPVRTAGRAGLDLPRVQRHGQIRDGGV